MQPEGPLLEAFWGKGDAAKALYREVQEIVARKYGPRPNLSSPKPAAPARKPRKPTLSTLLKQAAKASKNVRGAEVYPDRTVLQFGEPTAEAAANEWDETLRRDKH